MNSSGRVVAGISSKRTLGGALVAFALSTALLYLDIRLHYPEAGRPLILIAQWALLLMTSVCAAIAVTSIPRLAALGAWRVAIGLVTAALTFVVAITLLLNLQILFGGHM